MLSPGRKVARLLDRSKRFVWEANLGGSRRQVNGTAGLAIGLNVLWFRWREGCFLTQGENLYTPIVKTLFVPQFQNLCSEAVKY